MKAPALQPFRWLRLLAVVAILFGVLTIISGGSVLFNASAQQLAGNTVPFVLWFNFLAGFGYVIAGVGLWFRQRWAGGLAFVIATVTFFVFAAFGLHVWRGGSYELRTVGAMSLRTLIWLWLAITAYRKLPVATLAQLPKTDKSRAGQIAH